MASFTKQRRNLVGSPPTSKTVVDLILIIRVNGSSLKMSRPQQQLNRPATWTSLSQVCSLFKEINDPRPSELPLTSIPFRNNASQRHNHSDDTTTNVCSAAITWVRHRPKARDFLHSSSTMKISSKQHITDMEHELPTWPIHFFDMGLNPLWSHPGMTLGSFLSAARVGWKGGGGGCLTDT